MEQESFAIYGPIAMDTAREVSRLPDGTFTVAFYPYSRTTGEASTRLTIKEGCRWRSQMPGEALSISPDNLLLFTDGEGEPRMCYRVLIRFMAFPHDGYRLHPIRWTKDKRHHATT